MLQFIENVTQQFNMSSLKTHVGVLTFNTKTHVQTELTAEREVLKKAIQDIKNYCCSGRAYTHLALNTAGNVFANSSRNITTTKAVVLVTDSTCNKGELCPEPIENAAQRLYNGGINIVIVDISRNRDPQLEAAVLGPDNKYIRITTFSDLDNESLVSEVSDQINKASACSCYNLTDCDSRTKRCKRLSGCEQKYYFIEVTYAACCNDNEVCTNDFTCNISKKQCQAYSTSSPTTNSTIVTSRSTKNSTKSPPRVFQSTPSSSNTGLIIGIVAALLIFFLILVLVILFIRRQKEKRTPSGSLPEQCNNAEVEISTQENVYSLPAHPSKTAPKKTPSIYAELGPGGGRIGGSRAERQESHYR